MLHCCISLFRQLLVTYGCLKSCCSVWRFDRGWGWPTRTHTCRAERVDRWKPAIQLHLHKIETVMQRLHEQWAILAVVLILKIKSFGITRVHIHILKFRFSLLLKGLVNNITFIMIPVSIIDSCLFFLMLACLGGVVWSLWQPSPAHTTIGNQACSQSPFKRRAVGNVLVVVVPAVISYLPVVAMVPLIVYLIYWDIVLEEALCYVFESASMFPRLGLLIGPLFYLSKARQMCWLGGTEIW